MKNKTKIGVVQNFAICADFSRNIRRLVQGYRDCIDQGADLVLASAYRLCGLQGGDLCQRDSYLKQTQLALAALCQEINCAPLLLAAYSKELDESEYESLLPLQGEGVLEIDLDSRLMLYLLEHQQIHHIPESSTVRLNGMSFCVEIGDEESLTDLEGLDFTLRMATQRWHHGSIELSHASRSWEAEMNRCPLVCVNAVGEADGAIYAGGSSAYDAEGRMIGALHYFQEDCRVFDLSTKGGHDPLPSEQELLRQALLLGIRQTTMQGGFKGACIPMDDSDSPLVLLLATEALGADRVMAISHTRHSSHAAALGVRCTVPVLGDVSQWLLEGCPLDEGQHVVMQQRLSACVNMGVAEKLHHQLLSPLSRHRLVLGDFTPYAQGMAHLLPLGGLYSTELRQLMQYLAQDYPDYFGLRDSERTSELDHMIQETYDQNRGVSQYLCEQAEPYLENDLRYVQRRSIASESKRRQLPTVLQTRSPDDLHQYPLYHRLND